MSLESNLTRYSVKDYYLNAGMCYLAIPVSPPFHPASSNPGLTRFQSLTHYLLLNATSMQTGLRSSSPRNAVLRAEQDASFPTTMEGRFLHSLVPGLRRGRSASLRRASPGIRPHQENPRLASIPPSSCEEGHSGRADLS